MVCMFYHSKKLKKDFFRVISACLCLRPLGLLHAGHVDVPPHSPLLPSAV